MNAVLWILAVAAGLAPRRVWPLLETHLPLRSAAAVSGLGVPFDIQTPAGLRTAYPLKKMDTVEVVRRGIQYELPRLPHARGNSQGSSLKSQR